MCCGAARTGTGQAVNINIAWRRNKGRHLNFGGASENTAWMAARGVPLAQGGVAPHTPHSMAVCTHAAHAQVQPPPP